jgi:hypothetical protein
MSADERNEFLVELRKQYPATDWMERGDPEMAEEVNWKNQHVKSPLGGAGFPERQYYVSHRLFSTRLASRFEKSKPVGPGSEHPVERG